MGLIEQGVIGYLTEAELEKYRHIEAAIEAVKATSGYSFSPREAVQAYIDRYVFLGIMYADYRIPRMKEVWVSPITGAIVNLDETDSDDEEDDA